MSISDQHHVWGLIVALFADVRLSAMALALFVPILLLYSRNEIRVRRLRTISDFIGTYPATKVHHDDGSDGGNPSLEFVASKYIADLITPKASSHTRKWDADKMVEEIETAIRSSRTIGNLGDLRLFLSSLGLVVICYFGFTALYDVLAKGLPVWCGPTRAGGVGCSGDVESLKIIGALAFAGAFVAAARQFVRSLAVFDLSAYTFIWQTVEMFASVIFVLILFRTFPDPVGDVAELLTGPKTQPSGSGVPLTWVALAPLLGLLPQSATKFLALRMQSIISWVKMDDDRFNSVTRLTPLDVIDGIDYFTRFRLEECGIYDVQNLATYNPILLHIESPFKIFQAVDWISQAQLCQTVGLDRFLLLRQMNVRTIFDLERALSYKRKDTKKNDPDEFDRIFAGLLFAATDEMRTIAKISGMKPFMLKSASSIEQPADQATTSAQATASVASTPPTPTDTTTSPSPPETSPADKVKTKASKGYIVEQTNIENYCRWVCEVIANHPETTTRCVEHMMSWIADDLHVRRLRRIWLEMSKDLGPASRTLDSEEDTPSKKEEASETKQ
jgi:hypothetical protein